MKTRPASVTKLALGAVSTLLVLCAARPAAAQTNTYRVSSPSGALSVEVDVGKKLRWSVLKGGQKLIEPSAISLQLADGSSLGDDARVVSHKLDKVDMQFAALHYVKAMVRDNYSQLTLDFKGDFSVVFRAYDDAVAYRFVTRRRGELVVKNEEANFNFTEDQPAFLPYLWDYRGGQIFNASFESPYTEAKLSEFKKDSLSILPMVVTVGERRVEITEADLESYPGMYLVLNETGKGLKAVFAAYPLEVASGGFRDMNLIPTKRADYIAKTQGARSFPWRVAVITDHDRDLLANDIVQRLASPPRIADSSWIVPGQVSWDWWNAYNLTHVDFKVGINTKTFQHYIDFAAENHAKYIVLDWGWSDALDLTKLNPDVDVPALAAYGKEKGVGLILWASWSAITKQMHEIFPKYAALGIKGWKIDFIDRDDQLAVESTYEIAKLAAQYKMTADYHGVFKPTGLQRTYPNVVGYEGVYGLENFKWADTDAPRYAVTIPYIRNLAGPMDYTSGAMRNVTQADFKARNHATMAKGTRCNQLAQYVVFEVAFQMLSDSPSIYRQEQESTDFITRVPTVFDESLPLDGKLAEYVVMARRKGDTWYVGAMTNWTPRDLTIDLSFLKAGPYEAVAFADGINADTEATDYKKTVVPVSAGQKLNVHLAPGGGWAAIISRK